MAYEFVTTDPGSGGDNFMVDTITIGPDTVQVILNGIVFGPDGGPYVGVTSSNPFPVTIISSASITVDTELPTAAALADNTANPTVPGVGSFILCWDGATWDRVPGNSTDGLTVNLGANNDVTVTSGTVAISGAIDTELPSAALLADNTANPTIPSVGTFPHWFDGTTWDRALGNSTDGLLVNLGTNNDITISSGSVTISGTVTVDSELAAAFLLADNTANPTIPGVASFGMVYDGTTWDRMKGDSTDGTLVNLGANNDVVVSGSVSITGSVTVTGSVSITGSVDTELSAAAVLADNTANPTVTSVGTFPHWFDGTTWDRALGNATDGLLVNLGTNNDVTVTSGSISISGTVTVDSELAAAFVLADNTANPTIPGVASFGMLFDGTTWDRAKGDSTDGALVNLGTNNDVTVTGSVSISGAVDTELVAVAVLADNTANPTVTSVGVFPHWFDGSTWDRALGNATDGLLVNLGSNNDVTVTGSVSISGSVDTELSAAAALADNTANPTVTSVGTFNHVFDGTNWDRLPGTSTDGALVNLGANNDVTVTGNVAITEATPTSGGYTVARDIDLDEASPANIKASAGQVYGWFIYNNAASTRYVKLYNKASAPVLASDTPLITISIPAGSAANVEFKRGIAFSLGIGWAATTGVADADTGAPSANDVVANLFYA